MVAAAAVAVGTALSGGPRTSVREAFLIRFLLGCLDGPALVRVRVQKPGLWEA